MEGVKDNEKGIMGTSYVSKHKTPIGLLAKTLYFHKKRKTQRNDRKSKVSHNYNKEHFKFKIK